jgi:ABC-2 type transport system permease protein
MSRPPHELGHGAYVVRPPHELRLAWREWLAMITAGRRGRKRAVVIGLIVLAAIMHLPAYAVIGRFADLQAPLDKSSLIVLSATIFLAWA